jgi:hypothetical protein
LVSFFKVRRQLLAKLQFASNHRLGHKKMKEVFWKVDSESGYKFSDRTNPKQPVLFELDPSLDLAKLLKVHYSGTKQSSESVILFVEDETAYTESQAKKALVQLENNKEISVEPVKIDGKKRIKSKFPAGVIIRF